MALALLEKCREKEESLAAVVRAVVEAVVGAARAKRERMCIWRFFALKSQMCAGSFLYTGKGRVRA